MARQDLYRAYVRGHGFTIFHARGPDCTRPLSPHFHDEYLICAQLHGHEECQVAGKVHTFAAGDLVLINPYQVHTGNGRASDDLAYITLYVDPALIHSIAAELAAELGEAGAPINAPEFTRVRAPDRHELIAALQTLQRLALISRAPRLEIDEALHHLVSRTLIEFSNLRTPQVRSTNRVANRNIARALEYIRGYGDVRAAGEVSLDDLASVAELSKFHFLRQFNQIVGMTPGAYLRALRICAAARCLRHQRQPIVEVARGVGFADHPSFTRAFTRHMGMTPSQYQAVHLAGSAS